MSRLRHESGLSLLEVLVTMLVVTTGCLATLGTMSQFSRAASTAQTRAALISVAQRELELLRPVDYAHLGLTVAPPVTAATDAPLPAPAAGETLVVGGGGVVAPGADAFAVNGVRGRIYRWVTLRRQPCPAVNARVATELGGALGADVSAVIGDLCPGTANSKRIVIAVVPTDATGHVTQLAVRVSSIVTDPTAALPAAAGYAGLKLQPVVAGATAPATTAATPMTTQELKLYDSRCDSAVPAAATSHATRDTSRAGALCGPAAGAPDLMGPAAVPGTAADKLRDYSTDLTRPAAGGLVLMRDDRAGACTDPGAIAYSAAEADVRKRSLHTWATAAATAAAEIPPAGARGTLTLWTATAIGLERPARLCVVLRRSGDGSVIGSADYSLPAWPSQPTQLTVAFALSGAALAAGERLLLSVRVPADSGADLQLLYGHPSLASGMTVTTTLGKELR